MNPITLFLSRCFLFVIALAVVFLLGWRDGFGRGSASANAACAEHNIEQLTQMLNTTEQLTRDANAASLQLGKTISDRQQADAKTTKELRDALKSTAHVRVDCVFDDSVMRILDDARVRANTAAASGIGNAVPSAAAAR